MHGPSFKQPSAYLPLLMSLAALGLVLGHVMIYGIVRRSDPRGLDS